MKHWAKKRWRKLGVVVLALGALFATTFFPAPLPAPSTYAGPLPAASPPPSMQIFQLPTAAIHRNAGIAYRGGSLFEARDFAMTAVLVRHPRGDVLIDTGFGRKIDEHLHIMPWWFRAMTPFTQTSTAADRLDGAGYDRASLRGIILTHAHWDHVSGLCDFPSTPVLVSHSEREFVANAGWITGVARSCDARYEEYAFDSGPYLGFERSHDLYGDGAIVIVPAPGHTPGSVIVFVTLPSEKRFALVGDLVWQREGIFEREERPWLLRTLADADVQSVRTEILRIAALSARLPEIVIVPAHDPRSFAEMPVFGR